MVNERGIRVRLVSLSKGAREDSSRSFMGTPQLQSEWTRKRWGGWLDRVLACLRFIVDLKEEGRKEKTRVEPVTWTSRESHPARNSGCRGVPMSVHPPTSPVGEIVELFRARFVSRSNDVLARLSRALEG